MNCVIIYLPSSVPDIEANCMLMFLLLSVMKLGLSPPFTFMCSPDRRLSPGLAQKSGSKAAQGFLCVLLEGQSIGL